MANWSDEVVLIASTSGETNDNGFAVTTEGAQRTVWCNEKSISTSEFYKSEQAGVSVERKLELNRCDYDREIYVIFHGKTYRVVKTYTREADDVIELTLANLNTTAGG